MMSSDVTHVQPPFTTQKSSFDITPIPPHFNLLFKILITFFFNWTFYFHYSTKPTTLPVNCYDFHLFQLYLLPSFANTVNRWCLQKRFRRLPQRERRGSRATPRQVWNQSRIRLLIFMIVIKILLECPVSKSLWHACLENVKTGSTIANSSLLQRFHFVFCFPFSFVFHRNLSYFPSLHT